MEIKPGAAALVRRLQSMRISLGLCTSRRGVPHRRITVQWHSKNAQVDSRDVDTVRDAKRDPHREMRCSNGPSALGLSGDGVESLLQERSDLQTLLEPLKEAALSALSFAGSYLSISPFLSLSPSFALRLLLAESSERSS